jgi:predicted aspartyl protease
MGNVFGDITLKNTRDVYKAEEGRISEKDIRTLTVTALADTGASTLIIDDDIRDKLGLSIIGTRIGYLAGDVEVFCKITEPVLIFYKDRITVVHAWVVPGEGQALLGVIPLEDMDLMVDPVRQELVGAHGDKFTGSLR